MLHYHSQCIIASQDSLLLSSFHLFTLRSRSNVPSRIRVRSRTHSTFESHLAFPQLITIASCFNQASNLLTRSTMQFRTRFSIASRADIPQSISSHHSMQFLTQYPIADLGPIPQAMYPADDGPSRLKLHLCSRFSISATLYSRRGCSICSPPAMHPPFCHCALFPIRHLHFPLRFLPFLNLINTIQF